MPKQTIIDKIWDAHVVSQQPGHPAIFGIDLHLVHEVTSPQGFEMLREKGLKVAQPDHTVATLDHYIPTRKDRIVIHDPPAKRMVDALRKNVKDFDIPFYDFDSGHQGIVHVIGPELGLTQPGFTIVCGDSHTSTHGAFGALAFGVGTTEVGLVLATGCLLQQKPKTMRAIFEGSLKPGVFAKDMILALIAKVGVGGGQGHVVEYDGSTIHQMTMEERMTICNMSIEWCARAGLVAPDDVTFTYMNDRSHAPKGDNWDHAVEQWKELCTDEGASFDQEVAINVDDLEPMVTWGTNPEQSVGVNSKTPRVQDAKDDQEEAAIRTALEYVKLEEGQPIAGVPIQWAFLGSCTNARLSDLRIAAEIIKGRQVADGVTMLVVPGSEAVKSAAEEEGIDQIFIDAGAQWRNPGCSACLGLNDDKIPPGERCISSSNRNFIGRQGPGSITHLASPATVAASAIEGKIADPRSFFSL